MSKTLFDGLPDVAVVEKHYQYRDIPDLSMRKVSDSGVMNMRRSGNKVVEIGDMIHVYYPIK